MDALTQGLEADVSVTVSWPSPVKAWWAVAVFCLCAILSYTDRQILGLLVDPLRHDLAMSDTQISLLQGLAFAVIYSLVGLPVGRLADVLPRRILIVSGVVIWSAATLACGFAVGFGQLFAARIFVGIGEAALAPAAISMIGDLFPPHRRGSAIGVLVMGMIVGSGVALSFGGALLQMAENGAFQHLPMLGSQAPWRSVMMLLALPGIALVLLLATVTDPVRHRRDGALDAAAESSVKALLARRYTLAPLLSGMAFLAAGDFALLNWVPALLTRRFHELPGFIGLRLGMIAIVAGAGGALLGGWLSDRLAGSGAPALRARLAAFACLPAACAITIGLWSVPGPVYGVFGLWLLTSTAAGTMGIAAVQQAVPAQARGLTTAVNAFSNMTIGLGLGTMATALLTDHLFGDPLAVGKSLSLIALIGVTVGACSFAVAARRMAVRDFGDEV
jgi:predicted MFS family arabinose efflux permease